MAEITEQIVREAKPIEDLKLALMQSAQAQAAPVLPGYQIAGMTQDQVNALALGRQGIGAFAPYLQAGSGAVTAGTNTLAEAADVLRGADTRGQFTAAQQAYNQAAAPAAAIGNLSNVAGAGLNFLHGAGVDIDNAQRLALESSRADLSGAQALTQQGIGSMYEAAQNAQRAAQLGRAPTVSAQQVGTPMMQAAQMGPAERLSTQSFAAPGSAQAYMSQYMQDVVNAQQREARRASEIQGTYDDAAAVRAGAFGGGRHALMEAERRRNLATQLGDIQATGLQKAYEQAQGQFNVEQQARLAAQQANQQAGLTVGGQNLSAQQQANVQNQAAALQAQGMNAQQAMQAALANQQMQGQYDVQGAQLGLQAAESLRQAGIGSLSGAQQLATQNLQQAGLGQGAAGLYGQLGSQQANISGQYANIAGQQANILAQQSQLQQALGQGIGNLAAQQFGIGQNMAQGLGALGTQAGNLGMQQAALGQQAQGMGQQDVNFLYNLGAQNQRQSQAELDALRATRTQEALAPQQRMAFISDIYRGAPSTQMAVTQQQTPAPSPFQQIAGLGVAGVSAAAAGSRAGIL